MLQQSTSVPASKTVVLTALVKLADRFKHTNAAHDDRCVLIAVYSSVVFIPLTCVLVKLSDRFKHTNVLFSLFFFR